MAGSTRTLAIPTGPEDATLLNACVARILELDVPRKEIPRRLDLAEYLFKYWDQVRIVGEGIAPPVQICKKKNRLCTGSASYANLCIIHDRVFLPSNFREMVHRFGNAFPLTALQSIYFPMTATTSRCADTATSAWACGWTVTLPTASDGTRS